MSNKSKYIERIEKLLRRAKAQKGEHESRRVTRSTKGHRDPRGLRGG
jgi:hypothetical protein